jgi:hypothetical protein
MKNVTFSLFTSFFTLWPRTPLKENAMQATKPQNQRPENFQNGREQPHLFGFQPPEKFVGSLPPYLTRRASCTVASTGESAEQ